MFPILTLMIGILIVFLAALIFVNAIEYLGCEFQLSGSFVGATLAPLFTSFPEMVVFLVAVFGYGGMSGEEIGIGTLFGQPFMASSLSYGLVGVAVLLGYLLKKRDDTTLKVERSLLIPYIFITILFPLTILPSILKSTQYVMGAFFLLTYVIYVWMMHKNKMAEVIEEAEEPYLRGVIPHSISAGLIQLTIGVALLYIGSHEMVASVDKIASHLGVSSLGLALIIVPAATAIPETASALIWGYRGKDALSLGSLVGEKVLYSTFYPALGLFLTSWVLDIHAYLSVFATTLISIILAYYISKEKVPWYALCFGLIFFVVYSVMVFVYHI